MAANPTVISCPFCGQAPEASGPPTPQLTSAVVRCTHVPCPANPVVWAQRHNNTAAGAVRRWNSALTDRATRDND